MTITNMQNYRVTIGEDQYYIDAESPSEAATQIVEIKYKSIKGEVLLPIAILVQDTIYDGKPEMDDKTIVLYSPEIFANAGMYEVAATLASSFNLEAND